MRNEQYNPRNSGFRFITERAADYYREQEQPVPLQVCGDPLFWDTRDPGGMPEYYDLDGERFRLYSVTPEDLDRFGSLEESDIGRLYFIVTGCLQFVDPAEGGPEREQEPEEQPEPPIESILLLIDWYRDAINWDDYTDLYGDGETEIAKIKLWIETRGGSV